jgi:hypothetical protein
MFAMSANPMSRIFSARPRARSWPIRRLRLEALEDRCLLSSYTVSDLGTFGGPSSSAAGINSGGEVVGSADTNHFEVIPGVRGLFGKSKVRTRSCGSRALLMAPTAR